MRTHERFGYALIAPYIVVFLIFQLYPIINTLYLSFTDYGGYGSPKWVGFDNYLKKIEPEENLRLKSIELEKQLDKDLVKQYKIKKMGLEDIKTRFNITDQNLINKITEQKTLWEEIKKGKVVHKGVFVDKYFWNAFISTWVIWGPNVIMQLTLAFIISVWFTDVRLKIKGVSTFRAIFYFPNLVTYASIALLFSVLFDYQNGAINQLLFGDNKEKFINWMIVGGRARFIVSCIQTWIWFGHSIIFIMAGLNGIPETYYEAAVVDGANSWQTFWKITIPLIRPVLIYIVITSLIGGMQIFDLPWVLTGGSGFPDNKLMTMVMFLFRTGFRFERMGYAAAVAYILFFMLVLFSILSLRVLSDQPSGRRRKAQ